MSVACRKLQRFLPTLSLHHVNIFIKLLYLKKQLIIYGFKYELHQVERKSLKLLNCILKSRSFTDPMHFLLTALLS